MKKELRILAFALAAALVFAACDSGGDDNNGPPPVDNPAKGEMTKETAGKIFVTSNVTGGVQIDQFISTTALTDYINAGSQAAGAPSRPKKAQGDKTLVLNKIAGVDIVSIADNAFNPTEGADTLGDFNVKLPETLTSIGTGSFTGAGIKTLLVSETVKAALRDTLDTAVDESVTVVPVADADENDPRNLGDGVFVQADGSLYINAVIYDHTGEKEFTESKFVGVWNGDPWDDDAQLVKPTNAVSGERLTITIIPKAEAMTFDGNPTISPENLQICEAGLYGMDTENDILDDETGEYHDLRLRLDDETEGLLWYADQDGSIKGSGPNDDGEIITYDIELLEGWNFIAIKNEEGSNKTGSGEGYRWLYPKPGYEP